MDKNKIENDIILKMREIILLYKRMNPTGTYLNLTFIQTAADEGRIHINNAYYDRDKADAVKITKDITM